MDYLELFGWVGLAVTWYDARTDLGSDGPGDTDGIPNTDAQVWGAFSSDGGRSFTSNLKIRLAHPTRMTRTMASITAITPASPSVAGWCTRPGRIIRTAPEPIRMGRCTSWTFIPQRLI